MPTPSLILWIDSSTSRLVSGWNSSATGSNLIFNQGDSVGIELHRVNAINGNLMSEIEFPETGDITLAIGNIETAPTSGSYVISYNGYSTGAIAYNATATDIQTALNGLDSITTDGGVTVSSTGNVFRVVWNNNGVRSNALTVSSNNLFPSSSIGIDVARAGTSSVRQITQLHIKQSPVAVCNTWVNQDPSVITCTQIHTPTFVGDVKVWRLKISPQPKSGTFLLSYQYGSDTFRTHPLDIASSSASILTALQELNGNLEFFSVTQSGSYSWDISTTSESVLNMTANGAGIVSFNSKYGVLSLNTIEVQDLLAGSASASAYVEVQLIADDTTTTLYQGTCTILNDLIDNDGATVVSRGDVMPVESVVRYDTSQSLTNSQKTQARTNISALGSTDLVPFTDKDIELETRLIVAEGNLLTTNQKGAIESSSSPSGSNVFITTSALTSALTSKANISHTHAISDVTNLQYSLDTLQNNINAINDVSLSANNVFTGTQRFNNRVGINVAPDSSIGLSLDATGVLFSDGSIQTTASLPSTGGTLTGNVLIDGGNITITNNNYVDYPDHFRSLSIQYDGISCGGDQAGWSLNGDSGLKFVDAEYTSYNANGITFYDNTTQTTAATTFDGGTISGNITIGDYTYGNSGLTYTKTENLGGGDFNTTTTVFNGTEITLSDTINENHFTFNKLGVNGRSNDSAHWSLDGSGVSGGDSFGSPSSAIFYLNPDGIGGRGWSIDMDNGFVGIPYKTLSVTNNFDYEFEDSGYTINDTKIASLNVSGENGINLNFSSLNGQFSTSGILIKDGTISLSGSITAPTVVSSDNSTQIATTAFVKSQGYLTSSSLSGYAQLSGATFTGKVIHNAGSTVAPINIATGVTPSAPVAGDIWIATTNLTYRDSTGITRNTVSTSTGNNFTQNQTITVTSSATPSLTVIQNGNGGGVLVQNPTGTGYSFKVEDATTPDATPFTIDASGRVGIGITPDTTSALNVDSTGIKFNSSTAQTVPFLPPPSDGNYYVYRNGTWTMATIYVSGGKNYLTI